LLEHAHVRAEIACARQRARIRRRLAILIGIAADGWCIGRRICAHRIIRGIGVENGSARVAKLIGAARLARGTLAMRVAGELLLERGIETARHDEQRHDGKR
jgi:hypothetical protein